MYAGPKNQPLNVHHKIENYGIMGMFLKSITKIDEKIDTEEF